MKPESMEQLAQLATQNMRIEGFGLDVVTVAPCPFCAEPDWMRWPVTDPRTPMEAGATCKSCHRGAKAIFTDLPGGGVSFEFVQTSGPAQPDWMQPQMRRLESN